jgi:conjugal transfer pilus assembly protein TraU
MKLFIVALLLSFPLNVWAENCPNGKLLGANLLTNVPWKQVFPMQFGGVRNDAGVDGWFPDGAWNDGPVCTCFDKFGIPEIGVPFGGWKFNQAIEVVSKEWCSSVAGGTQIGPENLPVQEAGQANFKDGADLSFYHYIQWSFPIEEMLSLMNSGSCKTSFYADMDVISPSFVIPTWKSEPLAFFANPLSIIFANMFSSFIGMAECTKLAVSDRAINSYPGVAGCWGNIYPLTGYVFSDNSSMTAQSLISTRAIAFSTSVGLEQYTVGKKAMCESEFNPNLIKDRFKFSSYYPRSESASHPIGKPTLLWGEWLNKLSGPDSYINLSLKYGECCWR